MRIGIVGCGFVGSAIAHAHQHDEVVINDPKLPNSQPLSAFNNCDAIFICVPSPSKENGHCDTSILEDTLKNLLLVNINRPIPIISKVTAPPEEYARLQKIYPCLVHSPEFLTAKNAIIEYKYAKWCIVGGGEDYCKRAAEIIFSGMADMRRDKIMITDIKTAAFYKYLMNSYLATKVTFMNDFYELAVADGICWDHVKQLSRLDDRIGKTHWDVPGPDGQYGWGGYCFPKDVAAIIMEAIDQQLDFELLQRVETINKKHRRKND
jgi:UDPglucose 6-dehydrogenase